MSILEIIVETYEDIQAAVNGGATQIDLKAHYPCSGISPSMGIIARALQDFNIPILIMVRPHARSFIPSKDDILTACMEIKQAKKVGALHFMTGFITNRNTLHLDALKALKDAVGEGYIHSNLVWELTDKPEIALEQLMELGFSSTRCGGKTASRSAFGGSVTSAIYVINTYQKIANDQITLLLAGGITKDNAASAITQSKIHNLHCGRGVRNPPEPDSPVNENQVRELRAVQLEAIRELSL